MKRWIRTAAITAAAGILGFLSCMHAEAAPYETEMHTAGEKGGTDEKETEAASGWEFRDGAWYREDEEGNPVQGWKEIDGDWYYFYEDGRMNQEELLQENAVYEFSRSGALETVRWQDNTGGGAYNAVCYDEFTQDVFDLLNEEKKELYFETHPEREGGCDTELEVYDRYAGFEMDMMLNKAAEHRLKAASEKGYSGGRIPEEGTLGDWLEEKGYRKNATWMEIYVKNCRDADQAFEKIMGKTEDRYQVRRDRTLSLEYYRYAGLAHEEKDGKHGILMILMR